MDDPPFERVEDEEVPPLYVAVDEPARPTTEVRVLLRAREHDFVPVEFLARQVQDVEFRFRRLLLPARSGARGRAAEKLAVRERDQAHCGVLRKKVRVSEQSPRSGLAVPEQEPTARVPVSRSAREDHGFPVRMGEQAVGSVDVGLALSVEAGIGVGIALLGLDPRPRGIPLQEKAVRVPSHEEAVTFSGHGVPLAVGVPVDPFVCFRVVAEEAHGECGPAADRAVRRGGHPHQVRTLARVVEAQFTGFPGLRVFDNEKAVDEVAGLQRLAVREVAMEQSLATGNDRLLLSLFESPNRLPFALVEFQPVIPRSRSSVHLAVQIAIHDRASLDAFLLREQRRGLAAFRVQRNDLAGRVTDREVDPARIVRRDGALVLPPVLVIQVAIVPELTGLRVERDDPAVRVRGGPDDPAIILRHAHGHLRRSLL